MADTRSDPTRDAFIHELRRALNHLYDPTVLPRSPLARLCDADPGENPGSTLQRLLIDAIEALKPGNQVPSDSKAWRVYHILYYRYVEQFTQREVATDLALSIRQLRRQEKAALDVLADYLWNRYDLEHKAHLLRAAPDQAEQGEAPPEAGPASYSQELEWLKRSIPSQRVQVREVVQAILKTVAPLVQESEGSVTYELPDHLPPLTAQPTAVRQALLSVITGLLRSIPRARVNITAEHHLHEIYIYIRAQGSPDTLTTLTENGREGLNMAQQLAHLCEGVLEVLPDSRGFTVKLAFPAAEQIPVLVIDDNVDTLRLIQRYLAGTRYRFIGTPDPAQVLELAQQTSPRIIVLDVMLPGIDGWELLGRLREHPKTRGIPIIVCTILPQEALALTLGAAEFIRKPVHQQALLSALDRQLGPRLKESR